MATIEDLANPIHLMSTKDLHTHILSIRRSRRIIKKTLAKKTSAKKPTKQLDLKTLLGMMSEEERTAFMEEVGG